VSNKKAFRIISTSGTRAANTLFTDLPQTSAASTTQIIHQMSPFSLKKMANQNLSPIVSQVQKLKNFRTSMFHR
tara:strand:+ start:172 stop:393 length:222 start_codon:yes stop_codon:yes gene_type:complete